MTRCAIVAGWAPCRGPPSPLLPCPSTLAPRRRFGSLPPPLLLPLRTAAQPGMLPCVGMRAGAPSSRGTQALSLSRCQASRRAQAQRSRWVRPGPRAGAHRREPPLPRWARARAARRHRGAGGHDQGHGPARTGVSHHYPGGHGLAPRAGTAEPVGTTRATGRRAPA